MLFKKNKFNIHNSDKNLVKNLNKKKLPSIGQLRHVGKFLNKIESTIISFLVIAILASLGWMGFNYYKDNSETIPTNGGTLIEGMVHNPMYINPILAGQNTTDEDISRLIYSSLLKYNDDLELVPDLAESYQVSEDGKTYSFILKENILFHNEEPLTIDDVLFTYQLIQNPEFKSPLYVNFAGVEITRNDDRTITFTIADAYSPFIHFFTTGILPAAIWESVGPPNFPLAQHNIKPIGSGPYKFDKLVKDPNGNIVNYELSRFDKYYGPEAYIENIDLKFFNDIQPAIDALINNDINALGNIPLKETEYTRDNDNIEVHALALPQYTAIFFNPKHNSFLKESYIRKALTIGLDKHQLIRNVFGDKVNIIDGPILPDFLGYDEDLPHIEFNIEAAQELFSAEGWKINSDNMLTKNNTEEEDTEEDTEEESSGNTEKDIKADIVINLTVVNNEESLALATAVKENWWTLGIKTELNIVNVNEIKEIIKERSYDALLYGENLGADPDLFPFWHSTQVEYPGLNLAQFENKQADTLIEEARQSNDELTRHAKYSELQKLIIDEYAAVFLYAPKYLYATNKEIKNYNNSRIIHYADRWNNFHDLYIKTKPQFKFEK